MTQVAVASRRCGLGALAFVCVATVQAQVAGTLGLASENRYRGSATNDRGPVFRASVLWDSPWPATEGAYAGLSSLWRTRDGRTANTEAMVGFSGRLNALGAFKTVDARWGWDAGAHRIHYGNGASRQDFNEAMVGLLAPGWSLRTWWTPRYFGRLGPSLYTELNASRDLDEHWRVFLHLGSLHYGKSPDGLPRIPRRTDAMAGASYVAGDWEFRLSRDVLLGGVPPADLDADRRGPAWVLGTTFAF